MNLSFSLVKAASGSHDKLTNMNNQGERLSFTSLAMI